MKIMIIAALASAILALGPGPATAMQELSDGELDRVTAGGIAVNLVDGVVQFQFSRTTASGRTVDGSGTVTKLAEPLPAGGVSSMQLSDYAQSNLSSFITVNAVNSVVQLLVNMNVNINSVVGSVGQSNAAAP